MAQVVSYRAGLSFGDSKNKLADATWRISSAMFAAYTGAANEGARAATAVGLMMVGIAGLSSANVFERRCFQVVEEDAAVFPADTAMAFHHDKISVSLKAAQDLYTMTIPARKNSVISTGMVDGILNIAVGTRTAEVDAFIVAIANGMLAKNGGQPIVQRMYVNR